MAISPVSGERTLAVHLTPLAGEVVRVEGWAHSLRRLGKLTFLVLRDRSGFVQCVLERVLAEVSITLESVVSVTGRVAQTPKAPGGVEITVTRIEVLSAAEAPVPFELNRSELGARMETLLDHRALSLRHPKLRAVFDIQAALVESFAGFLRARDFTQIHTPKIVASGTEGGSNLFPIGYFGQNAFLAQSPQFYKQMMVGAGFERVFEIGPVYRAETHNTSRHLNEYVSLDVEMGFVRDVEVLMQLEEALLRAMFEHVAESRESQLQTLGVRVPEISRVPRVTLSDARNLLRSEFGKTLGSEEDLDPEGERLLCAYMGYEGKPGLVFVTRYPRALRPMYALPAAECAELTESFDLLFEGLEITTGGLRIHQYSELVASIRARGLDPGGFDSYLEVFRCGMPPHGGFAIGLERLTARLLGLQNVREASAFPRDRTRLTP